MARTGAHVQTLSRTYTGQSLEETKDLVRKKLGLSNDTSIRFSQLHEGRHIDLEDGTLATPSLPTSPNARPVVEDDFEAFQHLARHSLSLDLSVFIGNTGSPIFRHMPSAPPSSIQVGPDSLGFQDISHCNPRLYRRRRGKTVQTNPLPQ